MMPNRRQRRRRKPKKPIPPVPRPLPVAWKFCHKCGSRNQGRRRFCELCGTKLDVENVADNITDSPLKTVSGRSMA